MIRTWQEAEEDAARHMRRFGFRDANVTAGGADAGIDVNAARAIAQVKFQTKAAISRDKVQSLQGAAGNRDVERFFFSSTPFSAPARSYADEMGIRLFTYSVLDGELTAWSESARDDLRLHGPGAVSSSPSVRLAQQAWAPPPRWTPPAPMTSPPSWTSTPASILGSPLPRPPAPPAVPVPSAPRVIAASPAPSSVWAPPVLPAPPPPPQWPIPLSRQGAKMTRQAEMRRRGELPLYQAVWLAVCVALVGAAGFAGTAIIRETDRSDREGIGIVILICAGMGVVGILFWLWHRAEARRVWRDRESSRR